MTSPRNIRAVIEVGGQVAASLPSATRRARAELQSLEEAQRGDVRQLRSLRQSLSYVAEGSETYNRRLQEIGRTEQSLDYRTDRIVGARDALKGAGDEAGGFRGRLMQVRAVLGPVGIAVGAATGLIAGLGAAFRSAGGEANELTNSAALYGQTVENIQRRRNLFQYFTQDAGRAVAAARNLLGFSEQFQRVRFGAGAGPEQFLGAQRLGFDPADLIKGRLDQRRILEQAIAGVQGLPDVEARLRLEQAGFSEDVRAAVLLGAEEGLAEAVKYQERQAVLSEEQLEANRDMGSNIDEILTQIGRLVQITLSGIAPPLLSMSGAILKWLAGPEGALRAEQQELRFQRGEIEDREEPGAERELAAIDRRLAEIPVGLERLRNIDLSGQYPGPLGNVPGAEALAERGVSAGDVVRIALSATPGGTSVLRGLSNLRALLDDGGRDAGGGRDAAPEASGRETGGERGVSAGDVPRIALSATPGGTAVLRGLSNLRGLLETGGERGVSAGDVPRIALSATPGGTAVLRGLSNLRGLLETGGERGVSTGTWWMPWARAWSSPSYAPCGKPASTRPPAPRRTSTRRSPTTSPTTRGKTSRRS